MHYYRYRSPSNLAIKELMYDELYFCSPEECNDPFDSKTFYKFGTDKARWEALLHLSWPGVSNDDLERVADKIISVCPLTYEAALSLDYSAVIQEVLPNYRPAIVSILDASLKQVLNTYRAPPAYFVSFSRKADDPLMWSHYGGKHQGWCLVFKSVNKSLRQCPVRLKKGIRRNTPRGLAPSTGFGIPEVFSFRDMTYPDSAQCEDAFELFPVSVYGRQLSETERIEFASRQQQQYLQKHASWRYEKESRLYWSTYGSFIARERIEYSSEERLLHFDADQLVGVIFGARITSDLKSRLLQILANRRDRIYLEHQKKRTIFPFAIYQADLSSDQREVNLAPEQIWQAGKQFDRANVEFEDKLNDWRDGKALVIEGSRSRKEYIAE